MRSHVSETRAQVSRQLPSSGARRVTRVGATRPVTKENGGKRTRPGWFPEESFESQVAARYDNCLASDNQRWLVSRDDTRCKGRDQSKSNQLRHPPLALRIYEQWLQLTLRCKRFFAL